MIGSFEKALFDQMPETVAVYEPDGTVVYANPAMCSTISVPAGTYIGGNIWKLFPGAIGNPFNLAFERVARTGVTESFEHDYEPLGRCFENHIYRVGSLVYVIASDITEAKTARRRLGALDAVATALVEADTHPDAAFGAVARAISEAVGDLCSLTLTSSTGDKYEGFLGLYDPDPEIVRQFKRLQLGSTSEGFSGLALRSGQPILIERIHATDIAARYGAESGALIDSIGLHSLIAVPLRRGNKTYGVLSVARHRGGTERPYRQEDVLLLDDIGRRISLTMATINAASVAERASRQLQSIADTLPVLVSLVGRDERYMFVNRTYEHWFGQSARSLVGRTVKEVVGEAAYARLEPHIRRALGGNEVRFDSQLPYLSGGTRDVRVHYIPLRASDGAEGFVAHVSDKSELTRAHAALRVSESRLSALVEQMPMAVGLVDASGRMLYRNEAMRSLIGDWLPSRDPANAVRWRAVDGEGREVPPLDWPGAVALSGRAARATMYHRLDDGSELKFDVSASPLRDDSGATNGAVLILEPAGDRELANG